MKVSLTVAALLLLLITFAPAASAQKKCSCKAPDNSCETKVVCRHAGAAMCSSNSGCYGACGGVEADTSYARISLKINKKNSSEVAAMLTQKSGRKIMFMPRRSADRFTLELKNHPVWHAFKILNKRGKVLVDGTPFDDMERLRRNMLRGGKVSVNFTEVTISNALAKLSFLSGLPFRVESGDAERIISISIAEATLDEIVARLSSETGVKIERVRERAATR